MASSSPSAALQHAVKFSVDMAYRRITQSVPETHAKQAVSFTCGSACVERVWVQGYVQPRPKRVVFSLADAPPVASALLGQPAHADGVGCSGAPLRPAMDVYTKVLQPPGIPSEQWPGLGLAEGAYVLVVGKLRAGKKGNSQEGSTAQASRIGILAHKVLALPGDAAAWHRMWLQEVQALHSELYAHPSQLCVPQSGDPVCSPVWHPS